MQKIKCNFWIPTLLICAICVIASGCGNHSNTITKDANQAVLTVLSAEEAKEINPVSYNETMALEKGLIKKSVYEKEYLTLQAAYLTALNQFLEREVNLKKYQNSLTESEYDYWPNDKSVYFRAGSFGRTNIVLRNTPFIERLDPEDLDILKGAISGEEVNLNKDLLDMVERTWKHIICILWEEDAEENPYEIVYDVESIRGQEAMNDALVLEISYANGYDQNGNMVNAETLDDKYQNAEQIAEAMEEEIAKKLKCHVSVLIKVETYDYEAK